MTIADPSKPKLGGTEAGNPGEASKTRGIRFSQSERDEIKAATERRGVAAAKLVRATCLNVARDPANACAELNSADLAPLVARTFRHVYMLVTLKRDELVRDERGEEVDKQFAVARDLQDQLQDPGST